MTDTQGLRDKIARRIHANCPACAGISSDCHPTIVDATYLADAVMPIVEAEVEALRNALTWYRTCFNIANAQSDTETQP